VGGYECPKEIGHKVMLTASPYSYFQRKLCIELEYKTAN